MVLTAFILLAIYGFFEGGAGLCIFLRGLDNSCWSDIRFGAGWLTLGLFALIFAIYGFYWLGQYQPVCSIL